MRLLPPVDRRLVLEGPYGNSHVGLFGTHQASTLLLLNEVLSVRMTTMGSKQLHNWNLVLSEQLPVTFSGTSLEPFDL